MLVVAFCAPAFAQDQIIAVVNNDVITQKDLDDFVNFMRLQLSREYSVSQLENKIKSITSDLLDRLVEDRLILQEAKKTGIKIDESRVRGKVDEIRKQYKTEAQFQDSLTAQGLVTADLENKIREQMLMYALIDIKVRKKITVNPADITDFYYANSKNFTIPKRLDFDSIMLGDYAQAKEVYEKLAGGGDLIDLSLQYPLKLSAFKDQAAGELRKEIDDVVFAQEEGALTAPVKIQDSHYIFRINKVHPPREQTLEEVRDSIYRFLFEKKMQESLTAWLEELKKHSYIKITQGQ